MSRSSVTHTVQLQW